VYIEEIFETGLNELVAAGLIIGAGLYGIVWYFFRR